MKISVGLITTSDPFRMEFMITVPNGAKIRENTNNNSEFIER